MTSTVVHDTHTMVYVTGEVGFPESAEFAAAMEQAREESPNGFIVDLAEATYFDSSATMAVVCAYKKVRQSGGSMAIVARNLRVLAVLEVLGLRHLPCMYVYGTLEEARQALPPSPTDG